MIAAQRLNRENTIIVFSIISNGVTWEFSKLGFDKFTTNITPCIIYELDKLFAVVNFVFKQCEIQPDNLIVM
ncbi:hypothetical protein ACP6PL_19385 [Dapis sp. BLCC M126]|uniref:hypothetical protein n=1 Tax=Dapis sp. BLCC M126 TaxID=3400189 RepID=UPI003CE6B830